MAIVNAPISAFTDDGLAQFKLLLQQFKDGLLGNIPDELLTNPQYARPISKSIRVEQQSFELKIDAARYLAPLIMRLDYPNKYYAPELWGWLSAFYFESVAPVQQDGTRNIGEMVRFVQSPGTPRGSERHFLAFPVRLYTQFNEDAPRILIGQRLNSIGEGVIVLSVHQSMLANLPLLQAADTLFWNWELGSMKRGAAPNSPAPGSLRRFVAVIQQLEVNYDLYAMSPEQILDLLPPEFDRWKNTATATE